MTTTYIEKDCIFSHNGQNFESGGAIVTDDFIIGYISSDMKKITDWHGNTLGNARVVSSWKVFSFMSDKQYQIEVNINGIIYTGRSMGAGMIYKGKVKKQKR
jgi:hypothetical protein